MLGTQCPPGIVTSAEKRDGKAGWRGGRTDSTEGERGWRGKTARLTPCWLVCLSRTPAQSGALAGRASSPPPPSREPDPSRASTPAPTPTPQPTWAGRTPVLDRGVCLSAPPAPRKVGTLRAGGGAGARSPSHSGTFASRTPALPLQPSLPLPSSGATDQRAREAIPGAASSSRAAERGGRDGSRAGRSRAWGRGAPGWRAVGWLPERREQAARPARTEREERSSALGAGRGRGRKLGRTRAGGGGGAPRRSNPGRAPRAPSRPAGGTEGDFHPDTPRTRPRPRCEAQRAAGPRGRVPEGLRLCTDEEWGRAWGSRLWDPVPEGVHGGAGAQRGSAAPQDQGPSVFRAPSRLQAKVGPGQEQGRGRGEGGRGLGRLRPRGADGDGWAPRGSFGPEMRIIDHGRKPHHVCQ